MGHLIDLKGRKIGNWSVLKRGPNNKHNHPQWLCQCDCGDEHLVSSNNLLQGRSKKCRKCAGSALKYMNICPGQKYNKWTVLEKAQNSKDYEKH